MPKRHPFNAKVIITEILTIAIWIFLSVQTYLSATVEERLINGGLLILVIIFGILLIRSVLKEIEQRSEFEALTAQLAAANTELKRLDERRGEFISLAAHQLRTPLAAIKGYASMLLEQFFGHLGEKTRSTLEKVSFSTNQLIEMVDDLLNLSQIEAGRTKYDFVKGNLADTVKKVTAEFSAPAREKGITLEFSARDGAPSILSFDQEKMREAVGNLLDNALKYTPQGGKVEVALAEHDGALQLRVKDSGMGMNREDLGRIFAKFVRAASAQKIDPNGLGLGLYFVKRVAEDHGGRVWAESEGDGKGSTFYVELPVRG